MHDYHNDNDNINPINFYPSVDLAFNLFPAAAASVFHRFRIQIHRMCTLIAALSCFSM